MRIKHIIEYLKRQNTNKLFACVLLAVICFVPAILAVLFAPIYLDSGYYLSIVERINDGLVPYKDLALGYTPLTFYIWYGLKSLFSIGISYEFYLVIHFIIQFICAVLVFLIANLLIQNRLLSYFAAALFLITSHWNEGNYVLLETPSLMWGLLALYLAFRSGKNTSIFILVGIFSSLSFLSKQYGAGFLILSGIIILFNNSYRLKQALFTGIGFFIPLLISFLIWGPSFTNTVTDQYGYKITYYEHIVKILEATGIFFQRQFPVLIVGLLYLPSILKKTDKKVLRNLLVLTGGISGFMLQFFFWNSNHYYLYIIPFASILSFYLFSKIKIRRWFYLSALIVTCTYSIYCLYYNRVYKIYFNNRHIKEEQLRVSEEISRNTDNHKTLYVCGFDLIVQYYLTNMYPPNIREIGYSFGPALTNATHIKQLKSADYIIVSAYKHDFDCSQSENNYCYLNNKKAIKLNPHHTLYIK